MKKITFEQVTAAFDRWDMTMIDDDGCLYFYLHLNGDGEIVGSIQQANAEFGETFRVEALSADEVEPMSMDEIWDFQDLENPRYREALESLMDQANAWIAEQ